MSDLSHADSLLFCSDLESILQCIRETSAPKDLKGREAEARREELLAGFLRQQTFPNTVDCYSSLLLLRTSHTGCHVTGHLNVAPELERLPLIERTGIREPFMYGHLLGFNDDAITDPDLQRARALCFSTEACYQEWIHLLLRILRGARAGLEFPQNIDLVDADISKDRVENLQEIFKEALHLTRRERRRHAPARAVAAGASAGASATTMVEEQDRMNALSRRAIDMFSALAACPPAWKTDIATALKEWNDEQPDTQVISQNLLTNLCKALLLSMRRSSYDGRHLGKNRFAVVADHFRTAQNIVVSGAGDLSMNPWNVAFYRDSKHPQGEIFIPFKEPSASRTYNCIIVWKKESPEEQISKVAREIEGRSNNVSPIGVTVGCDLAIAELQISKVNPKLRLARRPRIELDDITEFALYGKLVLRDGRVVPAVDVVEEFQDLRHLFWLPNINPSDSEMEKYLKNTVLPHVLHPFNASTPRGTWIQQLAGLMRKHFNTEIPDPTARFFVEHWPVFRRLLQRPRNIFNEYRAADVWLLEKALLEIRNLKHLACSSAIVVGLDELGAPAEWIEFSLMRWGYTRKERRSEVEHPGNFYWDLTAKEKPMLHIWLLPARYPCTMIGIGSPGRVHTNDAKADTLYLLAWGHDFPYARHSIWDCAEVLRAAGASYALVIDEGQDVFQFLIPNWTELNSGFSDAEQRCEPLNLYARVPIAYTGQKTLRRTSLRASVAFWQYHV